MNRIAVWHNQIDVRIGIPTSDGQNVVRVIPTDSKGTRLLVPHPEATCEGKRHLVFSEEIRLASDEKSSTKIDLDLVVASVGSQPRQTLRRPRLDRVAVESTCDKTWVPSIGPFAAGW